MAYLKSIPLLLLLCCGANGHTSLNQHVIIPENTPVYTVIGNIFSGDESIGLNNVNRGGQLMYSILRKGNAFADYFQITKSSGDIFLLRNLDREEICGQTERCRIQLDVAVSSETKMIDIFPVDILVTDVNDNAPFFREPVVQLEILEDAEINSTFPIPSAVDDDMGDNSVVTYHISPSNDLFMLDVTSNLDGTDDLRIKLTGKLDKQTQQEHRLRLEAKDGGSPQRTGTTTVVVSVKAVNRSPVFTPVQSTVAVEENSPINSPVIKITASDGDSGINGQLNYRISAETNRNYPEMFDINSSSGEVFALKMFDFEHQNLYRLIVEVVDGGSPSLTSTSVVNVNVLDVNDNVPEMTVNFLSGTEEAFVSESAEVQHFVAAISVSDEDSGVNADITCVTDDESFLLIAISQTEFQLLLKAKLDREATNQHRVLVTCHDGGKQPNKVSTEIVVNVLDENDNAPRFIHANPAVSAHRGAQVGQVICHVTAVDDDTDDNAKISYAIVPESQYFSVDQNSGSVFVSRSLDSVNESEVTLTVVVRDSGNPPKETSMDITVTLSSRSNFNPNVHQYNDFVAQASNSTGFSNAMIVVCVLILTGAVSAILIIVICCVRGRNSEDTEESYKSGEKMGSTISVISTEKLTKCSCTCIDIES